MSYKSMLRHRCSILRLTETDEDGMPIHAWRTTTTGIRCFLDLNFIRQGKDPVWSVEAGRVSDRSGVLFLLGNADIRSGDRITMTRGPHGTFQVEGAVDEAWRPDSRHHLELGVVEVAQQLVNFDE